MEKGEKLPRTTSPGMTADEWATLEKVREAREAAVEIDVDQESFRHWLRACEDMILALPTRRLM